MPTTSKNDRKGAVSGLGKAGKGVFNARPAGTKGNLPKKAASFRTPKAKQFKYFFRVLNKKETATVRVLLGLALLSAAFLAVRIYFSHLETVPGKGGEYTEGAVGNIQHVNPVLAPANDADMDVSRLVFSGLLKYDKNSRLAVDLAERYSISEDRKEYSFVLKEGVKWHDGYPFTADDVIFTMQVIQNSEFRSPLWITFQGVTVEKTGDYSIKFSLKEPFSPFLSTLTFGILPKHIWESISPVQFTLAEYNLKPVGTGPMKFESLVKDKMGFIKSYSLERNDDFYGGAPYLDGLTFKYYPDFEEACHALSTGAVEGLGYLPRAQKFKLEKEGGLENLNIYPLHLSQYTAVFFNEKNNEALAEKEVRQALAHATDKEKILEEALQGEGEIISGPVLPGQIGFNPDTAKYEHSPEKAAGLLDKAKWTLEEDKALRTKEDAELMISLATVDREENRKAAEIIKESWETLGIKTDLALVPGSSIQMEVIKPRNYEALLFGEIIGLDPDPYPFWHSTQSDNPGLNLSRFSSRKADKLLQEARQESDPEKRGAKYSQFQEIIAEEVPAVFLYNPTYNYAVGKKIKGIDIEKISVPSDRFTNIEEWYVKTVKRLARQK